MLTDRQAIITRGAKALYDYETLRSSARWDGKRPGLKWEPPVDVVSKSCGGFRAWRLHATIGLFGFSIDGYGHRAGRIGGRVFALIGDGFWDFPTDDSCRHHNLDLLATGEAKAFDVTNQDVPWEPVIVRMAEALEQARASLSAAITEYDQREADARKAERNAMIDAARSLAANA